MLCSTPILKLPDFDRSFVLKTDASDKGIGAVHLHEYDGEYFPVAYAGMKLTPYSSGIRHSGKRMFGNCLGPRNVYDLPI